MGGEKQGKGRPSGAGFALTPHLIHSSRSISPSAYCVAALGWLLEVQLWGDCPSGASSRGEDGLALSCYLPWLPSTPASVHTPYLSMSALPCLAPDGFPSGPPRHLRPCCFPLWGALLLLLPQV